MRKSTLLLFFATIITSNAFADNHKDKHPKKEADSVAILIANQLKFVDSINKVLKFETGQITLKNSTAKLNIPVGFKFLGAEQSQFILHKVWGNPERADVLGMIFPTDGGPFADSSFTFVISFEDMGYVKDDDANKIDYDEMMKDIQKEESDINKERAANGYEPMHFIGWAQKPFYDDKKKVLHWAKEIRFGNAEYNTLNYDVRVLGRKGVLSLNAIASMSELKLVQANIDKVLNMAEFETGSRYSDFNSNTDKIAAYTIGGLVAGKVLLKVGFLAKFWKLIVAGVSAAFYGIKKFFTGRGRNEESV
jgi:uncharacterized membrane-anchored protein